MAANSEAIEKARAAEIMSGRPTQVQAPASLVDPERDAYLKESESTLTRIARDLPDAPNNSGLRPDGSQKGTGFLGVMQRPDGGVSTELSIGVQDKRINGGKETDIPTMVPGLSKTEKDYLLNTPADKIQTADPTTFQAIRQKAVDNAVQRVSGGNSVFANSQPTAKADASSGLNNLFQNYRKQQQGLLQIEAQATDADSVRRVRAQRLGRDAAFRAQAEQMYGIPGAKGGAFDMMVQMDSAKLNALASQKTADNSWNDILVASRKAPKAGATDEKLEEKIGKLTEASSNVADNAELKRQLEENTSLLAKRQNMELRGLTPQQAQQEEFLNNQGYIQKLIALEKQGGVDAYGQPMTSKSVSPMQEIYARANERMIPTFQVVPNKDGTMKFGGVGAQALTKMPQGTIFAVRDPKGTMSILSRDTNSASGFTMIDMGVSTGTKAKPAPRGGATPATVTDDSALASADPNIYSVAPALAKDAFSAAQSTGRGAIDMVRKYTPVDYLIPGTPSNDAVAGFITPGYKGRQPKKR
jgi:hypothetical protein